MRLRTGRGTEKRSEGAEVTLERKWAWMRYQEGQGRAQTMKKGKGRSLGWGQDGGRKARGRGGRRRERGRGGNESG